MSPAADYSNMILGETREPAAITSRSEAQAALAQLLNQGRSQIDIVSRELDPTVFDRPEVHDRLKSIVLSNRQARVRILVREIARIVKSSHSIVELSRRLPTFIGIRVVAGEHRKFNGAFVLADGIGFLQNQLADRYDGTLHCNSPREADGLGRLFSDMWETGNIDPNLRGLSI